MDFEKCEVTIIHEDIVEEVRKQMPSEDKLVKTAELLKVFGDPTRIKIICALMKAEMCVCDLAALLDASHSAVSHQLKTLKQTRLVKYRRVGKVVYYSLDDDHIGKIFEAGYEHVME